MHDTAMTTGRRSWWHASENSLFSRRSVLALAALALTWAFSLTGLQRHAPVGLPSSVQVWARTCPHCGTVESVATLLAPASAASPREPAAPFYRLTIRMADGSIRRLEQPAPITPGSQVLVQDGAVRPVPVAAPAPAR